MPAPLVPVDDDLSFHLGRVNLGQPCWWAPELLFPSTREARIYGQSRRNSSSASMKAAQTMAVVEISIQCNLANKDTPGCATPPNRQAVQMA